MHGTIAGTVVWLLLGLATMAYAAHLENQVTGFIAVGWIMLALFSFLEYRKNNGDDESG